MTNYPVHNRKYLASLLFIVATLDVSANEYAEDRDYLPAGHVYSESVPVPSEVLGYVPGQWHVRHDQLVTYMQTLAELSSRINLTLLGQTYEERTLLQLTISSPGNLERLDSIKAQHRELAAANGAVQVRDDLPVLVSLNYSIHGNEPSGSNAALLVAYHLAAAQGQSIDELLDNTIIILNPSLNPDGLSLFATWVNYHKGKNAAAYTLSREHTTVWPAGRMNHYLFNLNRDWLFVQQRETQIFVEQLRDWLPHVFADFHETGTDTTAYFQPGVPSRVNPLTPAKNQELTAQLAEFYAHAYDEHGLLYYTKERFDDYYYGKGSSYGDAIGSIGLTFEVGSSRGHLRDSINGPLSFPLTIKKQVLTSLSLLDGAQRLRRELLDYQVEFFNTARAEAARDETQAYLVGDDGDPQRLRELCRMLLRQGIDVYQLSRDTEAGGIEFLPGKTVVVPTGQSAYRVIQSLFERHTEFAEAIFYDVSAWNAPMAFNLPFAGHSSARGIAGRKLELPLSRPSLASLPQSSYAYVFSWQDYLAPRALSDLLQQGVIARAATKPFSIQTSNGIRSYGRGSIVLPVQLQDKLSRSLHDIVNDVAVDNGIEISAVSGGLAIDGIDLGSSSLKPINAVRPLLLAGDGLSRSEVGEVWFLLDQRLDMPLPIVDLNRFHDVELNEFTHLILVNGDYESFGAYTGKLEHWIEAGGTLVVQRRAAEWADRNLFEDTDSDASDSGDNGAITAANGQEETIAANDQSSLRPYDSQESDSRLEKIAGAILKVNIDSTHPVGFGFDRNEVAVMRQGTHVLPYLSNPYSHPGRYTESPLLSGYLSDQNAASLRLTPAISAEKVGSGLIISFADNPNFRAYFLGSSKLFLNTLFFSQIIDYID